MDSLKAKEFIDKNIEDGVIPAIIEFIKIPSLSPAFDPEWESNGYMESAMNIMVNYVNSLQIQNYRYEILKEPGKPWLYFGSADATNSNLATILMYGHFDKQPHMGAWSEGLGPTSPVIKDGKLYGRGGADDGYAIPSSGLIVKTLQEFGIPHGKIFIIGENEEESDSSNLIYYMEKLKPRIGEADIIICLDSSAFTYETIWLTTSLRGCINIDLTVKTLINGVHSGAGSGIIPSTFRVLQQLLGRIEDRETGEILLRELHSKIEPRHYTAKVKMVESVGNLIVQRFPLEDGVKAVSDDLVLLRLKGTLSPTLVITGLDGLPCIANAGNVLHPKITTRLSFRLPPDVDASLALEVIKRELTRDPPYGAKISLSYDSADSGWEQKPIKEWLHLALDSAANKYFDKSYNTVGGGGAIPFMGFLGEIYPNSQFVITGILGPGSNAHSIDENIDIHFLKKVLFTLVEFLSNIGNIHKSS